MGIELDVLVGHPEHDLLFVATQVARAAGLKNPSQSISQHGHRGAATGFKVQVKALGASLNESCRDGRAVPNNSWLFNESRVYDLLLRGNAPQSEPFRKWVTEEVLPTIRKTGKYDAEQSSNPIAVGLMDELKALIGLVSSIPYLLVECVSTILAGHVTRSYEKSEWLAGARSCPLSVGVRLLVTVLVVMVIPNTNVINPHSWDTHNHRRNYDQ
ncbi:Bro-N domain-containing protein [Pseudomonas laurylsulfatiphila]|uniref:BRO-N domain-containing protein n=1 Tax=Pseudomonas laurylsulfatiphila TaxID=2011015 RepID=UPI003B82F825